MNIEAAGLKKLGTTGASLKELAQAYESLGSAARKLPPMPSMREIAVFRLRRYWKQYGLGCILLGDFWRWMFVDLHG